MTSMMEAEWKLLQDVISLRVPARDVNEWLEDSFEVGEKERLQTIQRDCLTA